MVKGALWPFGFGLSYTKFTYAKLKVSPERTAAGRTVTVTSEVTNAGDRAGEWALALTA